MEEIKDPTGKVVGWSKRLPSEPSPMNEAAACKGENYSSPPYPGIYTDGLGHSIKVSYDTRQPTITVVPTAPLSQCAFLHADGDPDFQCSFRPKGDSKYCEFHKTAVAGEITRAKAEAYDKLVEEWKHRRTQDNWPITAIVNKNTMGEAFRLSFRNTPDREN